jgi:hypothetical protein
MVKYLTLPGILYGTFFGDELASPGEPNVPWDGGAVLHDMSGVIDVDLDFVTDEIVERYDALTEEQKAKFMASFSKKTGDLFDTWDGDEDELTETEMNKILTDLIEESFEEAKPSHRGLDLLKKLL